jgi:polysaccharide biosynthesis/export protein
MVELQAQMNRTLLVKLRKCQETSDPTTSKGEIPVTKMSTFAIGLAILLFTLSVAETTSAQTRQAGPLTVATAQPSDARQPNSDTPALQQRNPRYRVMRDDVLTLSFPLSPELGQKVTIQPDGYITLQNAGSIYVQGMTVPELVQALKRAYANILHDPIIDVDLTDFQKPFFVVSGQVTKPGQYDLRNDVTVSEAIAVAGGFLPTAKTQVFLYHRVSANWVEIKKLSLKDILHGKNVEEDVQMQPGDMIFVPEKFIANFKKYVPYSFGMYLSPSIGLP